MSFNLQKEREATKGSKWFDMKAPEMSEELRNELEILQMRSELDPKRFYKRSEMKTLPKYFEVRREQLLLGTFLNLFSRFFRWGKWLSRQ
jgi:hypothetical protein